jgi:hypothetical protein
MPQFDAADMTLVFTSSGAAELEDDDGEVVWSSDEDGEWRKEHPDELLGEGDAEAVLTYLSEGDYLDYNELGEVRIEIDGADFEDVTESEHETN